MNKEMDSLKNKGECIRHEENIDSDAFMPEMMHLRVRATLLSRISFFSTTSRKNGCLDIALLFRTR